MCFGFNWDSMYLSKMLHWSSRNVKHSIRKLKKMEVRKGYLSMVVSVPVKEGEKERTMSHSR